MEHNNKNKRLLEEYNEAMITHAAKLLALEQEQEAERLFDEYSALPEPEYSEEFKLNIKELLKDSGRTESKSPRGRALHFKKKIISAAACILGVFVIGGTVLTVSSDAFLERLKYLIGKNFSTHTAFVTETVIPERYKKRLIAAEWETILYPSYLPEGFELVDIESGKLRYSMTFSFGQKSFVINIKKQGENSKHMIDTENSGTEYLSINDNKVEATYIEKDGFMNLFFADDNKIVIHLHSSSIVKQQLIDIAESVDYIEL